MPLPNVANGSARRCSAVCRARGDRCLKLAVEGCRSCKSHGGHKKVRSGPTHWNYRNAGETKPEREARRQMSALLLSIEDQMFALDMMTPGATRTRGRRPARHGTTLFS
jgi:hypothetical protein